MIAKIMNPMVITYNLYQSKAPKPIQNKPLTPKKKKIDQ